jgi:hypothetical protein
MPYPASTQVNGGFVNPDRLPQSLRQVPLAESQLSLQGMYLLYALGGLHVCAHVCGGF